MGGGEGLFHKDLAQFKSLCFPTSNTPELLCHVGLCFSLSKQMEPGCPLAPSHFPMWGGGAVLLDTLMACLLQAVFTGQPNAIPR